MVWGYLKNTNSVKAAKHFLQIAEVLKRGCRTKESAFFVLSCKLEKEKRKDENMEKENNMYSVSWVVVNKIIFVQKWHLLKIDKHDLCSEGKNAHFRCNYLFLEMELFW